MGESINPSDQKKDGVHGDSPFPLTDTDRWVLSQTDEEFHLHDWDELKEIIGEFVYRDYIGYMSFVLLQYIVPKDHIICE